MIPKGETTDEQREHVAEPRNLRPLSLANTSQKIFASAANVSLDRVAEKVGCGQQRGFVRGRTISDAVLEMEGTLFRLAQQMPDAQPGGIFLDLSAALASMAREWLFAALAAAGAPSWLCDLVFSLFSGGDALLSVGSASEKRIVMGAGIRQGCPAIGTLWAIAFDPILRGLNDAPNNGTTATVCGFVDDVGAAVNDLVKAIRMVVAYFKVVSLAAGLKLNLGKTQVLNLSHCCDRELGGRMSARGITGVKVSDFAKYLGVLLGPGVERERWKAQAARFRQRVAIVASFCTSAFQAIVPYDVLAFSVLRYVMMFYRVPGWFLTAERAALARIMSAPMNAMTTEPLAHLDELGIKRSVFFGFLGC